MPQKPTVRVGPVEFTYEQPLIDVSGGVETAEHQLLDPGPLIDIEPTAAPELGGAEFSLDVPDMAVQILGSKPKEFSLTGICTLDEANTIDTMDEGDVVTMRSHRHTGEVIVLDFDTGPRGGSDGSHAYNSEGDYLYDMEMELMEVRGVEVSE